MYHTREEMDQFSIAMKVEPLDTGTGFRRLACDAVKRAIMETDIYPHPGELRLDERLLSERLGGQPNATSWGDVDAGTGGTGPVHTADRPDGGQRERQNR